MIYIQKDTEFNIPNGYDAAAALYGALDNAHDYKLVTYEDVLAGKYDNLIKRNPFVGSSEFMRAVFNRANLTQTPKVPRNSNRISTLTDLKTVKDIVTDGSKWFIKPVENKLFTGFVLDNTMVYSCIKDLPDNTPVLVYAPFTSTVVTEYRVYVHKGKMVDIRHYSGDFRLFPNFNILDLFLEENDDFPIAYTMDIGLLEDGQCVVVEFNDMWAIGNYGIDNDLYFKLLKDRYFEIMSN